MKLSTRAKQQGVSYKTAWRWWKAGQLPVPAEQMPTGTVIVHPQPTVSEPVALYARVSSADQKSDLDRQLSRLSPFAAAQGLPVAHSLKEVGSGLNGRRRLMLRVLKDPKIHAIVVEPRDRLMRLGFEYVEAALAAHGRKVIVVDADEVQDDIVRDLHEVLVSLGARLYGKRAARNRAARAMEALRCK